MTGAVFCAALAVYTFARGASLLYIMVSALAFGVCVLWLVAGAKLAPRMEPIQSRRAALALLSVFLLLLTLSILVLYYRPDPYVRPVPYFILTALMTFIVAIEILLAPNREHFAYLVLVQIAIIGVSLAWSEQLIYPSVTGIDPFWHRMFTLKLLETNRIPLGYAYSSFPLMHLETASVLLVTNVDYKLAVMLSMGVGQVMADALFTYLLVQVLLKNAKLALLASLLLITADYHIQFGWWATPSTFASIFMLAIVYTIFKLRIDKPLVSTLVVTVLGLAMILSHTIVALAMALLLFVVWLSSKMQRRIIAAPAKEPKLIGIPIVFSVLMLGWWAYAFAGPFSTLADVIRSGFALDAFYKGPRFVGSPADIPLLEQGLSVAGFIVFFGLALLGSLYLISKASPALTSFSIGGLTILGVGFASLVLGREVLNVRWWYLAQIALAGPAAIGVFLVAGLFPRGRLRQAIGPVIVVAVCFAMITSASANMDNPTFAPHLVTRSAFTASEMEAAAFVSAHWNGAISSDYIYSSNPSSSVFANYYGVELTRIIPLDPALVSGNFSGTGALIVIREGIKQGPFGLSGGVYQLTYDPDTVLSKAGFNKLYDSGSVTAYVASRAT